ncbi:MAG: hypothetical protein M3389_12270, partial [Actinomycetota bacterium]|nr:hypothetical protein [Actinomycetota bacterium]
MAFVLAGFIARPEGGTSPVPAASAVSLPQGLVFVRLAERDGEADEAGFDRLTDEAAAAGCALSAG